MVCMPLIPASGRPKHADLWVRGQPGLQIKAGQPEIHREPLPLKIKKTKTNKTLTEPERHSGLGDKA